MGWDGTEDMTSLGFALLEKEVEKKMSGIDLSSSTTCEEASSQLRQTVVEKKLAEYRKITCERQNQRHFGKMVRLTCEAVMWVWMDPRGKEHVKRKERGESSGGLKVSMCPKTGHASWTGGMASEWVLTILTGSEDPQVGRKEGGEALFFSIETTVFRVQNKLAFHINHRTLDTTFGLHIVEITFASDEDAADAETTLLEVQKHELEIVRQRNSEEDEEKRRMAAVTPMSTEARYGKDVKAAVKYNHDHQRDINNKTSAMSLAADLINIPFHVHGSHKHCKEYFCKDKEKNKDNFQTIVNSPAFSELKAAFHRLGNRSHRLIFNVTSNFAESFMSVMAKTTSGKRIDYPVDGYTRRANSAALSYNCGAFWLPKVFPSPSTNNIWEKAVDYFDSENRRPNNGQKSRSSNRSVSSDDPSYGSNADPGENTPKELKENVGKLFHSLQIPSIIERDKLEKATVGQAMNSLWMHEKRYRSTASTSGRIFTFADHLDNSSLLKSTCYPRDLSFIKNVLNGINQEPDAKRLYSEINGVEVRECGLFVYRRNGILAASPDGLLPDNGIIEVKCVNCPPSEIPKRADNFLIHSTKNDPSSPLTIRKSHKYFRQIVMQLMVSEMDYSDLFVFHQPKDPSAKPLYFQERVFRDKECRALWSEMESKLVQFWLEDQAPEHANPRYPYTKSFRTPQYRAEAIALRQEQKAEAEKKKNTPRMSKEDVLVSIDTVIDQVIAM